MDQKKPNNTLPIIAIAAGLFWAYSNGQLPWKPQTTPVVPVAPINVPSAELQALLFGCRTAAASQSDKQKTSRFGRGWSDLAWVLSRETGQLTSGQLRSTIQRFETAFLARTDLQGAFPGWSAAANDAAMKFLGPQDGPIDRQRAVEFVNGLAWACGA